MQDYIRIFGRKFNRSSIVYKSIKTIARCGPYIAPIIEPKKIDITKIDIPIINLPTDLENKKIVHISDIHAGPYIRQKYLERVVNTINTLIPDITVITGDFSESDQSDILWCSKVLSQIKSQLGIYAVLGNHDFWNGDKYITETLMNSGINILRNEHKNIKINKNQLYISGIDDCNCGNYDLNKAMSDIPENSIVILLSHRPDIIESINKYKIDLLLCGHTHGGQWQLPFIGPIYLSSKVGKKHGLGYSRYKNTIIYTNRGIGSTFIPVRICCKPEITLLTLKKAT